MIDALVLSGGSLETGRFPGFGPEDVCKAQLPILGRPMVEWVVRGLRSCPQIRCIATVGDPRLGTPALRKYGATVTPEAGEIGRNLRAALDALPGAERVQGLSGDLPLVSREALEDLFTNAPQADLVYPYVGRADILRDFPERDWLFAHTPEGVFTGSSAALFRPEAVLANWQWVEEILNARRRSPVGLALMVGPTVALRYLLRSLRVVDVEKKLSSLLHFVGCGFQTHFTDLTMDVDKWSDVALVERVLKQREEQRAAQSRRVAPMASAWRQ